MLYISGIRFFLSLSSIPFVLNKINIISLEFNRNILETEGIAEIR